MKRPELHVVTTGIQTIRETVSKCAAVSPFVDAIHIREHSKTAGDIFELVQRLIEMGVPPGKIIINNRVDAAAALGVKGVQLGFHSLPVHAVKKTFPGLSIGKSVHSLEEALQAEKEGADYILFGHLYTTNSKEGLKSRGLEQLKVIIDTLNIPVVAIGGIKPDNLCEAVGTGAAGIAVMSGVFKAESPVEMAKAYQKQLELVVNEKEL